ncbi:hypothetical protein RNJ44_01009 [Nakaseomyces bracarensis]|uniref:Uncharacterized protein n=1 Tax=Nakaseomyces bracarensis TaxID=273131 RepID=A0ABR4NQT6_9SACH
MLEMSDDNNRMDGLNGSMPLDAHLIIHGDNNRNTELNVKSPLSSRHGSISSLNSNNLFVFNEYKATDISSPEPARRSRAVARDIIEEEEISNLVQCEHISSGTSSASLSSARDNCRRHHHRRPSVALKFNKPIIYK